MQCTTKFNVILFLFFIGLELTFFSGVYGTCISNSEVFGNERKGLLGLVGIAIGVGEIFGKYLCVNTIWVVAIKNLHVFRNQITQKVFFKYI